MVCVGARLCRNFVNTKEIRIMNYVEEMTSRDKEKWQKYLDEEQQRMIDDKVWECVPKEETPKEVKVTTRT